MYYKNILQDVAKDILLTQGEIDYFISLLRYNYFERKDVVLQKGNIAEYTYFINRGCFRVYHPDEKGKTSIAHFAIENHWISDLYSFLSNKPSILSIDALEETEALSISKKNIELLYKNVPKFERFFRIKHQRAFVGMYQRLMKIFSSDAYDRYRQFKKIYPDIEQRISQKQIAAYLGITPEYLSMLKSRSIEVNE